MQEHATPAGSTAQERDKERVGRFAARYVEDGMRVGLGTGSTVSWTLQELGRRRPDIVCTATSRRTREIAEELGLTVRDPDDLGTLDVTIDGADEVDPDLNLIKGGGGALTREKIVCHMSARYLVVADGTKLVDHLGAFGTPLEVLPFAPSVLAGWLRDLGATSVRTRTGSSDNGNLLMDVHFGLIPDPARLAASLAALPGLVEHGLFPGERVERVLVAEGEGIRELTRP